MKYNQPYGISDPEAPYINGNPATGTMGSIPPAASIEFPQREIVKLITDSGLTPDNGDLTQLMKAMKRIDVFNVFKAAVNNGTASQWSATVPSLPSMPPPTGATFWFKANFDSLVEGAMFSVNGASFVPVVFPDLMPVGLGDVHASAWLLMFFDGQYWQIIAGSNRVVGQPATLQKTANWYVNAATGHDTNFDGTSATVQTTTVGPFKTISRAALEVVKYNQNGNNQYVYVADGIYNERVALNLLNGSGTVFFKGNVGAPQNVAVDANMLGGCPFVQFGGNYDIEGFRVTTTGNGLDCIALNGGFMRVHNNRFGPCKRFHMSCEYGGYMEIPGGTTPPIVIETGGNAQAHMWIGYSGTMSRAQLSPQGAALNVLGAVNFAYAFIAVGVGASANFFYENGISGGGFVTGQRYIVSGNGVLATAGTGPNQFPGSIAGAVSTGGQYL
jgi:hypothetical protein